MPNATPRSASRFELTTNGPGSAAVRTLRMPACVRAGAAALCALLSALPAAANDCGVAPAPAGTGTVTILFNNLNPTGSMDAAHTWVTFGGATTGMVGSFIGGGGQVVLGKSYRMSTLTQGVKLSNFNSGRIYISYGSGLTANAANCWSPNFANPGLADYSTRWDKVELTWNGVAGGANLTAQDFFGIPLQLTSSGGGQAGATLTWRTPTATAMNALGALCGFSMNTVHHPTGAIVTGAYGVTLPGLPGESVVRVINPATVTADNDGGTGFPSFTPYLTTLRNDGGTPISTTISGNNGTYGSGLQTYSLKTYIANAEAHLGGGIVRVGDLVFDGVTFNGSANAATIFVIRRADLTDHAIYGATAPYVMLKGSNVNAIVEKVRADYLSALNFGFANSATACPTNPGKSIGASPSWAWYGNPPSGINQPPMPITYAFATAQPGHTYYNQYANYLTTVTDAYGFAFNDRLQAPLAPLGPGSTVHITVLTDAGSTVHSSAPGPMDLVLQNASNGRIIAWDLQNFAVGSQFEPFEIASPVERVIAVADWNRDGQPDVITHQLTNGYITVHLCYNGQVFASSPLNVLARGPAWRLIGVGDLDGDERTDLAWVRESDGTVEFWRMNGPRRIEIITPNGQVWRAAGTRPTGLVDWNDDGVVELAVWDTLRDAIDLYSLGGVRFIPFDSIDMPNHVAGAQWFPAAFGDFDGDSDVDVIFQKRNDGSLRAISLDGAGLIDDIIPLVPPANGPAWRVRNSL